MLNNRQDLLNVTKKTYEKLFERIASRYYNNEQYTVVDLVGYECTKLEDIFRPMWGLAGVLKEEDIYFNLNGKSVSVVDFICDVMINGTNENSPKCFSRNVTDFDKISFANQSITEIAAYFICVFFAKDKLWNCLNKSHRDQIAIWTKKWAFYALRNSWPNNHYWYPIFCIEILKRLGYDCSEVDKELEYGYNFLENLYYGKGWYSDGELGRFDFYEAWAHHSYTLLWTLIADKTTNYYLEKSNEYKKRSQEYFDFYSKYFDQNGGMSAYGRSIGYRFAAICPFGLGVLAGCDISYGLAKNLILKNINYFYENSIPAKDGCFPLGYLYESAGFAESYASDGAIACYTEGLMCLLIPKEHDFWQAELQPLPIEKENYIVNSPLSDLQIALRGEKNVGGVTLFNNSLHYYQDEFFNHRFNDMAGYYSKFCYNSRSGFALSTADNVSSDNMISLYTVDGVMASHRRKILNSKYQNGVFSSTHIPFSNDKETFIKTYLYPMQNGWHVLIHKVKLSQEYIVLEGGFSVGVLNDNFTAKDNCVKNDQIVSLIYVDAPCKVTYSPKQPNPGMHLLAPRAVYPTYQTPALAKGEYLFITSVYFSTNEEIYPKPTITKTKNSVIINDKEIKL